MMRAANAVHPYEQNPRIAPMLATSQESRAVLDEFQFEELQQALLWAIAGDIRKALYQARLPPGLADALTKHLLMKMSHVLDGRRALKTDFGDAALRLSFRIAGKGIEAGSAAWTIESVQSTLEALLSEPPL
jgi:hypothetical protein